MSGPNEGPQETFYEVTNGLDEDLAMSFHGDRYEWAPGEKLMCTQAAIAHIFGYGLKDKTSAFLRLGWINTRPECNMKTALAKIAKIHVVPVQQAFNEVADARAKRAVKKTSASDRPFADAGESSGGVDADPTTPEAPPDAEAY